RALGRAQRLPHAYLTRALGDTDHHDRDDPHTANEQADRRKRDTDDEESSEQLVVDPHYPILRHDLEVVLLRGAEAAARTHERRHIIGCFLGGYTRFRLDDEIDAAHPRIETAPRRLERNYRFRLIAAASGSWSSHWTGRVVIDADHLQVDAIDPDRLVERVGRPKTRLGQFFFDHDY